MDTITKFADNLDSSQTASLKTACGSENLLNRTTELCIDLKTYLVNDKRPVLNKEYLSALTHDGDDHFKFVETAAVSKKEKRNPHLFKGDYITATLLDNGEVHLHFRQKGLGKEHFIETLAIEIAVEVFKALSSTRS